MLPNTYWKLEYIESTGTQYINTGDYIGTDFIDETDCIINNTSGSGYQGAWSAGQRWGVNNGYITAFGGTATDVQSDSRHTISMHYRSDGFDLYIDDAFKNSGSRTVGTTEKYFLFCSYYSGSPASGTYLSMRVYSMKLSSNGAVIRDFIPSIRKSDFEVGLYDDITGTFFASSSSSPFIPGPILDAEENIVWTSGDIHFSPENYPLFESYFDELYDINIVYDRYLGNVSYRWLSDSQIELTVTPNFDSIFKSGEYWQSGSSQKTPISNSVTVINISSDLEVEIIFESKISGECIILY